MDEKVAKRLAVLSSAVGSVLHLLPDQPLKRQLIELADEIERDADNLVAALDRQSRRNERRMRSV